MMSAINSAAAGGNRRRPTSAARPRSRFSACWVLTIALTAAAAASGLVPINPSVAPSSRARAALSPKLTVLPLVPGTGMILTRSRSGSMPAAASRRRNPISTQGAAPAHDRQIAAPGVEIGAHDEKPVHALGLRADELDAVEFGKGGQRRMRRAGDKIDPALGKRAIGGVDREDQLKAYLEPLPAKEPEFDRRRGRKIGIRDQVGNSELHHGLIADFTILSCQ